MVCNIEEGFINMSSDYKVLVVVDLQNCFIQGGSLGSIDIKDIKKYIELVKEIDKKISQTKYDIVVFSKDSHPLNHSSLFDNTNTQDGVYTYHCRNSQNNCIKNTSNPTTYMSSNAKNIIRDLLCNVKGKPDTEKDIYVKKHFYDVKNEYEDGEYNFYNPQFKKIFTDLVKEQESKIKDEINDKNYKINSENTTTLEELINKYISNSELDHDSIEYLTNILNFDKYKKLKVQGLDLNYLFYNTGLKEIIFNLNNGNNSEIGIKQEEYIKNYPNYDRKIYNVDNIECKTSNNTKFITIAKGQYCDYESYSAFNYHINIKKRKEKSIIYDIFERYDSSLNFLEKLPAEERYSTGLFEYILKDFNEQTSKQNINIDVCGLVTNICVINTVHQGIAMWEKVYKEKLAGQNITCKFNLLEYLSIPLSIEAPDYTYFNYKYEQQIKKENDLNKLLQINNLKTLFTTKFEEDVIKTNVTINKELSYTVDYDIDVINSSLITSTLNFIHNIKQEGGNKLKYNKLLRNKVKKYDDAVYIAHKKVSKKEILGRERCIYKKHGDHKEYLKYKGSLITVSEYKKQMKSK